MERILLEVRANRFNETTIHDTENIANLLHKIVETDFVEAKEAMGKWRKALNDETDDVLESRTAHSLAAAENAKEKIDQINRDIGEVRGLINRGLTLAHLVEDIRRIASLNEEILRRLEDLQRKLIDALLQGSGSGSGTGSGSGSGSGQ
jgi:hypothetical protein